MFEMVRFGSLTMNELITLQGFGIIGKYDSVSHPA